MHCDLLWRFRQHRACQLEVRNETWQLSNRHHRFLRISHSTTPRFVLTRCFWLNYGLESAIRLTRPRPCCHSRDLSSNSNRLPFAVSRRALALLPLTVRVKTSLQSRCFLGTLCNPLACWPKPLAVAVPRLLPLR